MKEKMLNMNRFAALAGLFAVALSGCAMDPEGGYDEDDEMYLEEEATAEEGYASDGEEVYGDWEERGADEISSSSEALTTSTSFCWTGNYGRGVGTVPDRCSSGWQLDAGLCYPKCASGYDAVGPVCWQRCPSGYIDDGAFCRRDAHIISSDNSSCPWYDVCGLTFAAGCSKCPKGYQNDGCTCRRDAHIFAKASYGRGAGQVPTECSGSREYDAGLCYPRCEYGYFGVGPVCWGECPDKTPVTCGAGCAISDNECASQIITQVTSSLEVAANIASAVTGTGLLSNGVRALSGEVKDKLQRDLRDRLLDEAEDLTYDVANLAAERLSDAAETGDFDWSELDPTGIMAVVEAFDHPSCHENVALGRPATQSSTRQAGGKASRAVDGNTNGNFAKNSVTHTNSQYQPWWKVDLGERGDTVIRRVVLHNRTDCCSKRLSNFKVQILDKNGTVVANRTVTGAAGTTRAFNFNSVTGRYVRVKLNGTGVLSLAEVEVF